MTERDKAVTRARVAGGDLRQMLAMGTTLLEENVELVNSLNVFPVPDGDTGTNMLLTMQSAMEELGKVAKGDVGAAAQALAHGALMGARGNSGVILSQILRGLARFIDGRSDLDGAELASALKEGANTAYRGIGKPVEGTILTVARESADAAVEAGQRDGTITDVIRAAVAEGRASLERTPDLLPTLKEAGVVDAGGQGYLLILEGALLFLSGDRTPPSIQRSVRPAPRTTVAPAGVEYGYCTEVLIRGDRLRLEELRRRLDSMGTSIVIAGESDLVHVHVHTQRPGDILNLAVELGSLEKIKVENMQLQHTAYVASKAAQERPTVEGVGVVVVSAGEGLAKVFRDLGAASVVPGGQTMNPSIEDLVHGAASCGFTQVILLPNNPNVVMTAQQSQALTNVELRVVPTRTIGEGIAALVAFNREATLEANVAAMSAAAASIQTIELTHAVRTSQVNGLKVVEGQAIALLGGKLVQASDSLEDVALAALEMAGAEEHEVVTLYRGDGISESDGESLSAAISGRWSTLEVQLVDGGQPHYPFIITVE